jgi:protein-tyrosine phosphatase
VFGWLFAVLAGFDKPFNQAPSLHIALLVILWVMYQRHTQGVWRWVVHGWFGLIGISVLTTYQHHFIDLPTGALAGWICVWLWPTEHPSPLLNARLTRDRQRWRLGVRYGLGALALVVLAFSLRGWWLWLLWPAVSLGLIKANYLVLGATGFQKRADGRLTPAARWLYAPYLAAAWINSRLWTRKHPQADLIVDNVWLGRIPTSKEQDSFKAIVDLCAELPINPQARAYQCVPVLDLIAPTPAECQQAAEAIERLRASGPLLVCCALGYSRSATAFAAWLLHTGRATTVEQALTIIRTARADVVLHPAHREALEGLPHAR